MRIEKHCQLIIFLCYDINKRPEGTAKCFSQAAKNKHLLMASHGYLLKHNHLPARRAIPANGMTVSSATARPQHPHLAIRDGAVSGQKGILVVEPMFRALRPLGGGNTPLWPQLSVDSTSGLTQLGEIGSDLFLSSSPSFTLLSPFSQLSCLLLPSSFYIFPGS